MSSDDPFVRLPDHIPLDHREPGLSATDRRLLAEVTHSIRPLDRRLNG